MELGSGLGLGVAVEPGGHRRDERRVALEVEDEDRAGTARGGEEDGARVHLHLQALAALAEDRAVARLKLLHVGEDSFPLMTSLARMHRAKQLQKSFVLRLTSSPCATAVFQSRPATSDCLPTPTLYARRASSRACRLGSEASGASSAESSLMRFIEDAHAH